MDTKSWASGSEMLVSTTSTQSILLTIILLLIVLFTSIGYRMDKSATRKQLFVTCLVVLLSLAGTSAYIIYRPSSIDYLSNLDIQSSVPARVILTVLIFILTYISTIALDITTQRMVEKEGKQVIDDHRREVIFRILQLTMYIFVAIGMLNYWNINIRSILIGAGALAAIIGLSARHTLSAALAGIVLLFSRPFKVGDWIQVGETEGTVRRITIVNTIMQTPKDEQVVIPNDVIGKKTIKNKTNSDKLRVSVDVEVAYEEETDTVLNLAEDSVLSCDIIADVPEPTAHLEEFNSSGFLVKLHFWIRRPTPRRKTVSKANVNKIIKDAFDEEDIEIPYPKRNITVMHSDTSSRDSSSAKDNGEKDTEDIVIAGTESKDS